MNKPRKFAAPTPGAHNEKRIQELQRSQQEVLTERAELSLERVDPDRSVAAVCPMVEKAVAATEATAQRSVLAFKGLNESQSDSAQGYRQFKVGHRIDRDARLPDTFFTAVVVLLALCLEGLVGAGLFLADGKADIVTAGLYGFSIAGINVAAGMTTGFFAGRYLGYRLRSQNPEPGALYIRCAAWAGLILGLAAMLLLGFAAARTRVTGSHKDIFTFDDAGFLATFNDYYALALIVLGLLGWIVAYYKGLTGIKDPIPGFSEARSDAKKAISDAAEHIEGLYSTQVEQTYEAAADHLSEAEDAFAALAEERPEALVRHCETTIAHNHAVDAAELAYLQFVQDARRGHEEVYRVSLRNEPVDLSVFEKLRVPAFDLPPEAAFQAGDKLAHLRLELDAACDQALASIAEAYATFVADIPNFITQEQEDK